MTTYTLIAYRQNGIDTHLNIIMGRTDSAFECEHSESPDETAQRWALYLMDNHKHADDREIPLWELTLLIDGKLDEFDGNGAYEHVKHLADAELCKMLNVEKAANIAAAEAAAKEDAARKMASSIRKERAEFALFRELQKKYGARRGEHG